MHKYTLRKGQKPTKEQLREVEAVARKPIVFDEDCPELSPAMLKKFKRVVEQRNRRIAGKVVHRIEI